VALVRERTIPTERPPPVGEVSANDTESKCTYSQKYICWKQGSFALIVVRIWVLGKITGRARDAKAWENHWATAYPLCHH